MRLKPEYEIVALAAAIESALAVPGPNNHGRNALLKVVAVLLSENPDQRKNLYDLRREALWKRVKSYIAEPTPAEWERLDVFRNGVLRFMAAAILSTKRFKTTVLGGFRIGKGR